VIELTGHNIAKNKLEKDINDLNQCLKSVFVEVIKTIEHQENHKIINVHVLLIQIY
jgi:hypothetical protein